MDAITCVILDIILLVIYIPIYRLINGIILKIKAKLKAAQEELDNSFLSEGYEKVCNNFYINQKEKKVAINNKYYDFAQIVDCELCEDTTSTKNTYGKVYDSKIIGQTATTYTTETAYLVNLYINITVDDFVEPNVQLNLRGEGLIKIGSQKYIENRDEANRVLSTLKLIKSKS